MVRNFPNELLINTLGYVLRESTFKELTELRKTCKKWNELIPIVMKDEISRNYQDGWKIVVVRKLYIALPYGPDFMEIVEIDTRPVFDVQKDVFDFDLSKAFFPDQDVDAILIRLKHGRFYLASSLFKKICSFDGKRANQNESNEICIEHAGNGLIRVAYWKIKSQLLFGYLDGAKKVRIRSPFEYLILCIIRYRQWRYSMFNFFKENQCSLLSIRDYRLSSVS
ncbi:12929_t:CDS:2 [Acaulospora morrowiae]|uniref:12929_t:CDS:1 n=1 Tax=Acaulospora morrowiae TaxID=94023 RepID=A0A9N9G6D0_9GLOM|nr:12929_t:CDS:2 [Acaulospora morrowiae]